MPSVELVDIDEAVLEEMIAAAVQDAAPNEVTAPLDDGTAWTAARVDWMRALHRDRRSGLSGPLREATWAIVLTGRVVGAIRLKRTEVPDVLETGIWLTRGARGRGVATAAMHAVIGKAVEAGARGLSADTTVDNVAAQAVLRRLDFDLRRGASDDGVRAFRRLGREPATGA